MTRVGLAQLTIKEKKAFCLFMNQIKSIDTVISLCVGRLLVSVLLTPSLTPDTLSVDLGPIVPDYRLTE